MPDDSDRLAILRLAWRADAIDAWRKDVEARLTWNTRELERLVKADEIADAVASKMNEREGWHLTLVQKRLAIGGVAVTALGVFVDVGFQVAHALGG